MRCVLLAYFLLLSHMTFCQIFIKVGSFVNPDRPHNFSRQDSFEIASYVGKEVREAREKGTQLEVLSITECDEDDLRKRLEWRQIVVYGPDKTVRVQYYLHGITDMDRDSIKMGFWTNVDHQTKYRCLRCLDPYGSYDRQLPDRKVTAWAVNNKGRKVKVLMATELRLIRSHRDKEDEVLVRICVATSEYKRKFFLGPYKWTGKYYNLCSFDGGGYPATLWCDRRHYINPRPQRRTRVFYTKKGMLIAHLEMY